MQTVLFISDTKPDAYPIIDKHYEWYGIHKKLTFEEFSEIYHNKKPYAIYTHGNINLWNYLSDIFDVRKKWVHLQTVPQNLDIISCVFSGIIEHKYDSYHPLLSVITTTYNSKEKIQRPWRTLRNQTYTNWEWIIWDDSEDTKTYENLLEMQKKDLRMRVYRAPKHSGIIGEMKRLASGVAYGSFIIELDHDDEIHPELFQWVIDASKMHKEADFFYTDSAQLYERTLKTHSYGDFFGYGYGSHAYVWSEMHNQWVISTVCAPPNGITLRHLIGMPNHIRVWKTELYDRIGKHNPRLSVSDDYELLVKSYIHGKWCHIRACGYYQYRNEDGNFTFIRNSLIQHNVKYIYDHYKSQLPQPVPNFKIEPAWKFEGNLYPTTHLTYDPYPHENSIILIDPTLEKLQSVFNSNNSSFHVYIIGNCPLNISKEQKLKITWWDLGSDDINDKIRYAKKFLVTGKNLILENQINIEESNINIINEEPSINIITPCSRQDNLDIIVKSINFDLINKWYIVYDTSKNRSYTKKFVDNPKIEEHFCSDNCAVGNSQRNFGLDLVKDGFVYFLDDDNIIHPEFWNIIPTLDINYYYTFDQQRLYEGRILYGNRIKINYIDTAQYIIPKHLIKNLRWDIYKYEADGIFIIMINNLYPKKHKYISKIASYYNYLEKNNILQLSNINFNQELDVYKILGKYGVIYNELFKDLFNKNISIFHNNLEWSSIFPNADFNKDTSYDIIIYKNMFNDGYINKLNRGGYYIIEDIYIDEKSFKNLKEKYHYLEFLLLSIPLKNTNILLIKYPIINQKVLAYYFPQYHSIPENDEVFGQDFTDWELYKNKNSSELSLFKQPIQPPNGLGFYDPTQIDVRKTQASLAKKYGVDGFIYYHYWLENKPVMNKLFDKILEDNEPNLPFCFCFANQSWTHRYGSKTGKYKSYYPDGSTFRQLYDKPKEHALYLSKLFNHTNYIRINNHPVLYVYIFCSEVSSYLNSIIKELKQYNIDNLYIIACTSYVCLKEYNNNNNFITHPNAYSPFKAHLLLESKTLSLPEYFTKLPCAYGGCMGWNSMLRHPNFNKIFDFKPHEITKNVCQDLLFMHYDKKSPQVYSIFAWNEWTEGAIIEPNSIYGEELGNAIQIGRNIVNLLFYDNRFKNIVFEYGLDNNFINITKNVHKKCIDYINNKWVIYIPKDDCYRPKLFGDPLQGVVKVIKVIQNGISTIYDDKTDFILEL